MRTRVCQLLFFVHDRTFGRVLWSVMCLLSIVESSVNIQKKPFCLETVARAN